MKSLQPKHYLEEELSQLVRSDTELWSFIQRASLDGLWYWNLEKPDEEWMSPEFWRLFGHDPATKAHDPAEWQDIIFEEDLKVALDNFEKHCADPDHPYDQVVRYRHRNGSTVWVRCRGVAIRDAKGKPIRMLGAHNDITEAKTAQFAAERDRMALDQALSDMKTFTYGLNHDLRAPVRSSLFFLEEVTAQLDAGDIALAKELAETSRGSLKRLAEKIDYLLEYASAVEGTRSNETVDVEEIFSAVASDLSDSVNALGGSLTFQGGAEIEGQPMQLGSLLQNLVENGLKYHHPDRAPEIKVWANSNGSKAEITVSDNGIGIEEKYLDYVLQPFKRLHRDDDIVGSGLGLSACKRIAESHGGTILIESAPGKGTDVHVILPILAQKPKGLPNEECADRR